MCFKAFFPYHISLSIYLTFDLSHHPTSLTMINSLDLKGRCPMTSLQKNWKLHRRPYVFFLGGRFFRWGNLFYEDAIFVENWSFREFMFIPRVWLIVPCHTFGSNSVKFGGWKVKHMWSQRSWGREDMGCKIDGCFRMLALCWSKVLLVPTRARYVWHVRVE